MGPGVQTCNLWYPVSLTLQEWLGFQAIELYKYYPTTHNDRYCNLNNFYFLLWQTKNSSRTKIENAR